MSACECRQRVDEQLAASNARIKQVIMLSSCEMPIPIATEQIDSGRGKPKAPMLFASHCPFCGVSLKGANHDN